MRSMQKMWEDYAKEVQVLRERIAELREVRDMERSMADIAVYAENEKAGESACA